MRGGDIPCNAHPDPSESQEEDIPVEVGMYPYEVPVSCEEDVLHGWIDIAINYSGGEVMSEGDISTTLDFLLGNEWNDRSHLIREENRALGEVPSRSSPQPPRGQFLPPAEDGAPTDNANISEVSAPSFDRNSEVYEVDGVDLGRPYGFDSDVAQETDGLVPPRVLPPPTPVGKESVPCRRPPTPARARNVPDRRAPSHVGGQRSAARRSRSPVRPLGVADPSEDVLYGEMPLVGI